MTRFTCFSASFLAALLLFTLSAQAQAIGASQAWTGYQNATNQAVQEEVTRIPSERYPGNEFGFRYWDFSQGMTYDIGKPKVAHFDYNVDDSQEGELYFRMASRNARYLGIGGLENGNAEDIDYANGARTSDTKSDLSDGRMDHFYLDFGYKLNDLSAPAAPTSLIVGAGFFQDIMTGEGQTCQQAGGACSNAGQTLQPIGIKTMESDSRYTALRVGFENNWTPTQRITWRNEIVVIPLSEFRDEGYHPQASLGNSIYNFRDNGFAYGTQMETMLDFRITPDWSLNLGAQYWLLYAPETKTKVGNPYTLGTTSENSYDWRYHRFGAFAGAAYHF